MGEKLPSALEIVRTSSLASLVAEEVERMIVSGEIAAGERLNEQALAAQLRVSRAPIREAIRGLERSGLVVTVVNQGSYVRQVSETEATEIYRVRAVLTGYACAELANAIQPTQLAELADLVAGMDTAGQADDAAGYFALNRQFHTALLELAGNACAVRICEGLGNELNLFRRRALVPVENMHESNAEHDAIVRAIAAKDPVRAREAGEAHILGGMRRFIATRPGTYDIRETDAAEPGRGQMKTIGRKRNDGHHQTDGPADDRGAGDRGSNGGRD
jgi:DNA-binding GntR family transcriptional regulator